VKQAQMIIIRAVMWKGRSRRNRPASCQECRTSNAVELDLLLWL